MLPMEVLRQAYGASLHVDAPRVRLIEGVQVREPIMHVRISLQTRFQELVKNALKRRGVVPSEEYARSTYCVLRYEARLADLLGLPAELGRLTGDSAKYWIVPLRHRHAGSRRKSRLTESHFGINQTSTIATSVSRKEIVNAQVP
jgi:translation elongation factor EF-G